MWLRVRIWSQSQCESHGTHITGAYLQLYILYMWHIFLAVCAGGCMVFPKSALRTNTPRLNCTYIFFIYFFFFFYHGNDMPLSFSGWLFYNKQHWCLLTANWTDAAFTPLCMEVVSNRSPVSKHSISAWKSRRLLIVVNPCNYNQSRTSIGTETPQEMDSPMKKASECEHSQVEAMEWKRNSSHCCLQEWLQTQLSPSASHG